MLLEHILQEDFHRVPEQDRVRNLHHRRLQVQREQRALVLGRVDLFGQETAERLHRHEGGIDDRALFQLEPVLQDGNRAIRRLEFDLRRSGLIGGDGCRNLVRVEIVAVHRRHMSLAVGRPGAHRMRIGHGIVLDRLGRAPVRIALAQNRVHDRALDRVVFVPDRPLLICRRVLGVVGHGVTLRLQLGDRTLELRDRRRDIRQLDHVRFRLLHKIAQLCQVVGMIGEGRQNAPRKRNVLGPDRDSGGRRKGLDDRQKRRARQLRRFVYLGIHNVGTTGIAHGCVILQLRRVMARRFTALSSVA